MIQAAHSVTVAVNTYELSTTSGADSDSAGPSTATGSGTTITSTGVNNRGNEAIATATASDFTLDTEDSHFCIEIDTLSTSAIRMDNPGNGINVSVIATYSLDFQLAAGELGVFTLDFDYTLVGLGGSSGELSWRLIEIVPGGTDIEIFAGSETSTTTTVNSSVSEIENLDGGASGKTYSLELISEIPSQSFNNGGDSVDATFSNIKISVPEPSTTFLMTFIGLLLLKRNRSDF